MAAFDPILSEHVLVFTVVPAVGGPSVALEKLVAYVSEVGVHARLSALDTEEEPTGARVIRAADMSGTFLFRAHSKAESARLEELLRNDPRVRDVYRPPAYRARRSDRPIAMTPRAIVEPTSPDVAQKLADSATATQWGYERCGFSKIRRELDHPGGFAPIVMIDNGSHLRHPQLSGVIRKYVAAEAPHHGSIADHSSAVAGIIAARRGPHAVEGVTMDGCCPAEIEMYNAWTTSDGLDHDVLYKGLMNAIKYRRPVVNMSIWLEDFAVDQHVALLLEQCEQNNVVVVAAIGNAGTNPETFFPATHPTVVAVAATDATDQRQIDSSVGRHAFIAAPGEKIYTIVDMDYDRVTGTSFAAPFVTAAVWLARRRRPDLIPVQVRWLLSQSVATPGAPRNPEVGFGRLDMQQLVKHLDKVPPSDKCARFLEESLGALEPAGR